MRYLKYILFLVILFPFSVNAALCDNTEKIRLQKLAQNITYSYDYVEQNGSVTFDFTFYNMSSEVYLVNTKDERRFDYSGEELVLGGFLDGMSYKFEVRAANIYCDSSALYYIYINTPPYNRYYNDSICQGVNYKYCNKWQKNTLSYEEFVKNVENYKKEQVIPPDDIEDTYGIFDMVIDFYSKYYFIILPVIIVVGITYIIIYRKKNDLF